MATAKHTPAIVRLDNAEDEVDRLKAVNAQLLEALEAIADRKQNWGDVNVWDGLDDHTVRGFATAAIKAATESEK